MVSSYSRFWLTAHLGQEISRQGKTVKDISQKDYVKQNVGVLGPSTFNNPRLEDLKVFFQKAHNFGSSYEVLTLSCWCYWNKGTIPYISGANSLMLSR